MRKHLTYPKDYLEIRNLYLQGVSQKDICLKFGIKIHLLSRILYGPSKKYVAGRVSKEERQQRPRLGHKIKLEDYETIKQLALAKKTNLEIANQFGVSRRTISGILNGKRANGLGAVPPRMRNSKTARLLAAREKRLAGMPVRQISKELGLSVSYVNRLLSKCIKKRKILPQSKYSLTDIERMVSMCNHLSKSAVARHFKCSRQAVGYIVEQFKRSKQQ